MSYLQAAFDQVCQEAQKPETWFVVLVSRHEAYGGPEEGGWNYTISNVEAFQEFPTEEAAEAAAERVKVLAKELEQEARREYGEHCLREMEFLDARGLDADFLPEPDGPDTFHVIVTQEVPQFDNRRPVWE